MQYNTSWHQKPLTQQHSIHPTRPEFSATLLILILQHVHIRFSWFFCTLFKFLVMHITKQNNKTDTSLLSREDFRILYPSYVHSLMTYGIIYYEHMRELVLWLLLFCRIYYTMYTWYNSIMTILHMYHDTLHIL